VYGSKLESATFKDSTKWDSPLVPSKDLGGRGSRHGCDKERVPDTVLSDGGSKGCPVPEIGRHSAPQVELEFTLRDWGTFVGLVLA